MKQFAIIALFGILLLPGCVNQNQTSTPQSTLATQIQSNELRQVELSIEGLWCEGCVYGIQSLMNRTPGIQSAEIKVTDYVAQTGIAKVTYDSQKISKEKIAKLTEPYPSKIVKDASIS